MSRDPANRGQGGRNRENEPLARVTYTDEKGELHSVVLFTQLAVTDLHAELRKRGLQCEIKRLR